MSGYPNGNTPTTSQCHPVSRVRLSCSWHITALCPVKRIEPDVIANVYTTVQPQSKSVRCTNSLVPTRYYFPWPRNNYSPKCQQKVSVAFYKHSVSSQVVADHRNVKSEHINLKFRLHIADNVLAQLELEWVFLKSLSVYPAQTTMLLPTS